MALPGFLPFAYPCLSNESGETVTATVTRNHTFMNHAYRRRGSKQGYTLRVQFPRVGHAAAEAISDGTVSYGVRRLAAALKAGASSRTPKWHSPP